MHSLSTLKKINDQADRGCQSPILRPERCLCPSCKQWVESKVK